jgi:acetylglutamate kinase
MVRGGEFDGGIIPKLLAAARAAKNGVEADIGCTAVVA